MDSEPNNTENKKSEIAQKEEKILAFWKENNIFEKSLEKESPKGEFVFYDGPATANGKPGIHHLEPGVFKDIIPRYKTMRGFHVPRKIGWDTHGLPVELQVEKALGLKSKKEIETYGIEAFNKKCKESVWEYIGLWQKFVERFGRWVDQKNPYITYENTYIESVWGILKTVNDKKLLYKDYKVLPWCPRCGTALSSHELAQGYQDDKDLSVTAKFKITNPEKIGLSGDVYLLAWTTTPWTLPGNVALAVGKDIDYVKVRGFSSAAISETAGLYSVSANPLFIISKEAYKKFAGQELAISIEGELKGSELVGLKYEPLYHFLSGKFNEKDPIAFEKAYHVYAADFVNTEDGTGIVHTAVMYGQDDFVLGTEIGLPKYHLVNDDGHFHDGMDFLSGRFVKEVNENGKPTLAVDIIDDLKKRNLFFKQENIVHSYPHCWRCKTPLIYYARDSWYIKMSSLRGELVAENEGIHWEPEHIKEGRFGEWLREIKDWAISRERYWGTPLPIWQNADSIKVAGSIDEFKKLTKKSGNKYFVMRHGETEGNVKKVWSCDSHTPDPLTRAGVEKVRENAIELKNKKIDLIISSPYMRTRETASLVAEELGISHDAVVADPRLGEWNVGSEYNGKSVEKFFEIRNAYENRYTFKTFDGESYAEVLKRAGDFLYDMEKKYTGKNILIISHGAVDRAMSQISEGFTFENLLEHSAHFNNFNNAEIRPLDFVPLPHNANYELDLHKPFIDAVELVDENGEKLIRVKEVLDVWFDSGSMPFAQDPEHIAYPADYISEAIDQTRGWFYTLHAIGVLTGRGKAYKNVVCLGLLNDKDGKKMSKSLGNTVDPWLMMDKYGADALRLWMFSVNQPGDSKNFDEKTVDEIVKKVFNPLENILAFYDLYKDESFIATDKSTNILDKWILARLHELVSNGTKQLDNYKIFEASRVIRDFINDFSTWYIRRSRERFKSENMSERADAVGTTRFVFLELAKYMAPFTPFFAEMAFSRLRSEKDLESVHLCDWPDVENFDEDLILRMKQARIATTHGLMARQDAQIIVRQPLEELKLNTDFVLSTDLQNIVKDEVNIKKITFESDKSVIAKLKDDPKWLVFDDFGTLQLALKIEITDELKQEGIVRDIIRAIQDIRKKENLISTNRPDIIICANDQMKTFIEVKAAIIKSKTFVRDIKYSSDIQKHQINLDNQPLSISVVN